MTRNTKYEIRNTNKTGLTGWVFYFVFGISYFVFPFAFAAKDPGTTSADFLKVGIGGRGVAMGEAQTAAVNDVMALYWNPAVLGELNMNEASFMHHNFFQGIKQDALYYAHPTESWGTLAGGLALFSLDGIQGYDYSGAATQELSLSDTLVTLGWGKSWDRSHRIPGLSAGVNFKFLDSKLGDDSANTFMSDVGLVYEFREGRLGGLRTGAVLQNLGGGLKYVSEESDLPRQIKAGMAYPVFGNSLTLAADVVSPLDNDLYFNAGLDYRVWNMLSLRAGYKGQNDLDTGITYGMSLGDERMHLDYAFVPFGELGNSHRVSVGFRFGNSRRPMPIQSEFMKTLRHAQELYAQGRLVDAYYQAAQVLDAAPWHEAAQDFLKVVRREFVELEDFVRKDQLETQVEEHLSRGKQHLQREELSQARREFVTILALQPQHVEASSYLKRIDEYFRNITENLYDTGAQAMATGNYQQAREAFLKVLVLDSQHAQAREQLTALERQLGEEKRAAEERARRLQLEAVYKAAQTLFERKDYEGAYEKFGDLLRMDPENLDAKRSRLLCRDRLANGALDAGRKAAEDKKWDSAIEQFKRALTYKPDFPDAKQALDETQSNMAKARKSEVQGTYEKGLEAYLAGDLNRAVEMWKKTLELDPDHPEAKRGLERFTQKSR